MLSEEVDKTPPSDGASGLYSLTNMHAFDANGISNDLDKSGGFRMLSLGWAY